MASFQREADMVPVVLRSLPQLLCSAPVYAAASECPEGYRYIDVVAAMWQDESCADCIMANPPNLANLSLVDLSLLAYVVCHEGATTGQLMRELFFPDRESTQQRLGLLESRGLIGLEAPDTYAASEWAGLLPSSVAAFELKLDRWTEGLAQATYTQRFADESYLVLTERAGARAMANSNLFESAGVGIVVLHPEEEAETLIAPTTRTDSAFERCLYRLRVVRDLSSRNSPWQLHTPGEAGPGESGSSAHGD